MYQWYSRSPLSFARSSIFFVRKIGAPGHPELAIGAVAEGEPPEVVTEPALVWQFDLSPSELGALVRQALEVIDRRRANYLRGGVAAPVAGRQAICWR